MKTMFDREYITLTEIDKEVLNFIWKHPEENNAYIIIKETTIKQEKVWDALRTLFNHEYIEVYDTGERLAWKLTDAGLDAKVNAPVARYSK